MYINYILTVIRITSICYESVCETVSGAQLMHTVKHNSSYKHLSYSWHDFLCGGLAWTFAPGSAVQREYGEPISS